MHKALLCLLPESMINEYIQSLSAISGIESIWLIGSRANECFTDDSDWDLLVFASNLTLDQLRSKPETARANIDVLVVYDGISFVESWPKSEDYIKRGDLKSWEWAQSNENEAEATYKSVKYIDEDNWFKENQMKIKTYKAIKLWPK